MRPPALSPEAAALVEALRLTPTELRRLWGFFYDAYCCNHAPGAAAEVKLEIGEWVEVLGDHGVPVAEANALFAAANTAGSFEDHIRWEDWALGLLAFDKATPHTGAWAARRVACVFRRYASAATAPLSLTEADFARLVADASQATGSDSRAIAAAAAPFELLLGGGSAMEMPEFTRAAEQGGAAAAALFAPLLRIAWSPRADDSLDDDEDDDKDMEAGGGNELDQVLERACAAGLLGESEHDRLTDALASGARSEAELLAEWSAKLRESDRQVTPAAQTPQPQQQPQAAAAAVAPLAASLAAVSLAPAVPPAAAAAALREAATAAVRALQAVMALLPPASAASAEQRHQQAALREAAAQLEAMAAAGPPPAARAPAAPTPAPPATPAAATARQTARTTPRPGSRSWADGEEEAEQLPPLDRLARAPAAAPAAAPAPAPVAPSAGGARPQIGASTATVRRAPRRPAPAAHSRQDERAACARPVPRCRCPACMCRCESSVPSSTSSHLRSSRRCSSRRCGCASRGGTSWRR